MWIKVTYEPHTIRQAEDLMACSPAELLSKAIRPSEFWTDRHTWIKVAWYAENGDDQGGLTRLVQAIGRSLKKLGIKAEYTHFITAVVPGPGKKLPTLSRTTHDYVSPGNRIEVDLIQPATSRSVKQQNSYIGGLPQLRNDTPAMACPVNHIATASAAEIFAAWSRAWKVQDVTSWPSMRRNRDGDVDGGSHTFHASLIASGRCPACFTEQLTGAPTMNIAGRERSTGRCPCCAARWLTDEPGNWACLESGQLLNSKDVLNQRPVTEAPPAQRRRWWRFR